MPAPLYHLLLSFQKIDLTRIAYCEQPQTSASSASFCLKSQLVPQLVLPLCLLCLVRYAGKPDTEPFIAQTLGN